MWKKMAKGAPHPSAAPPSDDPAPPASGSLIQSGAAFHRSHLPVRDEVVYARAGPVPLPEHVSVTPVEDLMKKVIGDFTLNEEQTRAFKLIAQHSLDRRAAPLRMYLGGPGGTGKSRVIDAVAAFFLARDEGRRLRRSSYTGVAARNISGMTLHAALGMGKGATAVKSGKGLRDLMTMWEGVNYLFVDEVSMVGCGLMYDISVALCAAKGEPNTAFGAVNMIFAGDFFQLPPVGQVRLYAHIDKYSYAKSKQKRGSGLRTLTASTALGQKNICDKLLWLSVHTVIMLDKPMRQVGPENEQFVSLLGRLRHGRCTNADFDVLNSHLLQNLTVDWHADPWKQAPIVVNENAMKDKLNVQATYDFAKQTGRPLHWYYAEDKIARTSVPPGPLADRLMEFDSGKSNQRLGKIPLVIGMPVIISQNFDVQGGVVNGSFGILKSVRYNLDVDGRRHAISCVVEVEDTEEGIVPGLPLHHVVALEDDTAIKLEHPYTHKKCTLHRIQLPIQPGFAMTAYKAQGKTFDGIVINLVDCQGTESPYVMVSRATTLEGLAIVSPFAKERICCRTSEDLRKESLRLDMLALRTMIEHGTSDEVDRAKVALEARYSIDADEPDELSSEDENTVRDDPWTRLNRKQTQVTRLVHPPRRKHKQALNVSRVVAPPPPSHCTQLSRRQGLDAQRPPAASSSQLGVARPADPPRPIDSVEHTGPFVDASSLRQVRRRRRQELDHPIAQVS